MLRDYRDIRARIPEAPLWFDDQGVPRYEPFLPDACGVYDRFVAYMEVACQYCGERFLVAASADAFDLADAVRFPSADDAVFGAGSFHYGDPPRHECVGDTMNVECVRVVEFWGKRIGGEWGWRRMPEYEITLNEQDREAS